jgi:hypothetical protein
MRGPLQGCEVDKEHEDLTWLGGGVRTKLD